MTSRTERQGDRNTPIRVLVVGGGTAGWMAAAALVNFLGDRGIVSLVESPDIGPIGVGEATLPGLREFNQALGIDEQEFIRATAGTFKLGIAFADWGWIGNRFFHPFGAFGEPTGGLPFHQAWARARLAGIAAPLDRYSLSARMAAEARFAQPAAEPPSPLARFAYAFHFDASRYGTFLRGYALRRGVRHRTGSVTGCALHPDDGRIAAVRLHGGEMMEADFFVDCTGFRALLIGDALGQGYVDWSSILPCDRAIAMPSVSSSDLPSSTLATAEAAGWRWRIPLQHRTGNGYVYSSAHSSDEDALRVLERSLGGDALAEPNMLRFRTGCRERFWHKNCVALGLASGFVEPLESTSIALVQSGLSKLLTFFPQGAPNIVEIEEANRVFRLEMESIRDFVAAHYRVGVRAEPMWQDCRLTHMPEEIDAKIAMFRGRGHVARYPEEWFKDSSWIAILAGLGVEPLNVDPRALDLPTAELARRLAAIQKTVETAAASAPDHREFVERHCPAENR